MIVGCYCMHLYCEERKSDKCRGAKAEYTGQTEAECLRAARQDGWLVNRKRGLAKCRHCVNGKGSK